MEPQSSFAFLVAANEAFGYTHEQTLDSELSIIMSMFREYGFMENKRSRAMSGEDTEAEYREVIDITTGEKKRVKKVKSI